ncbi:MAG: amidohydrolase family protein [Planctomycetota bacterium]
MRMFPALLVAGALAAAGAAQVAVRAEVLHTVAGAPVRDGVVVIEGGRITGVGPADSTPIPDGVRVLRAAVATPGLVDGRSVVGLAGHLNQDQDQDQLERSEPLQPELRALDAYNAGERLIGWVRSFGVTTLHTGHAPGALISGQTMVVKTRGNTVDDAVLRPIAAVAATLGAAAMAPDNKAPGTRAKQVAMLRRALIEAREYREKRARDDPAKRPTLDLRHEALARVLTGEVPLMVTAHRQQDLLTALRLAEEFEIRLILDGGAEAHLVLDRIAAAGVPVLAHPPLARHRGDLENATFELGAKLAEAGISFAYQSGYESYVPKTRVVLLEAAIGAAHGLGFDRALRAITIEPARILGLDDRIGSLEVGKDGDVALYDGDPFEYTSHCVGTVIEGSVVFEGQR